jgi:hypothetical protein
MDGFLLSTTTLAGMTPGTRAEILASLGIASAPAPSNSTGGGQISSTTETDDVGPASFSTVQMRKFLDGCSAKTRRVLEALAELPARFKVGDLLKKLDIEYSDLRGVLAGLTKRTRTISGDPGASLFGSIHWDDDPRKSISELDPRTHEALRRILKKA